MYTFKYYSYQIWEGKTVEDNCADLRERRSELSCSFKSALRRQAGLEQLLFTRIFYDNTSVLRLRSRSDVFYVLTARCTPERWTEPLPLAPLISKKQSKTTLIASLQKWLLEFLSNSLTSFYPLLTIPFGHIQ
ncbi:hypothetical protein ACTXT7_012485 [Hymenolepis weldensis]